jgi:predicted adenine nucleotide alpha hydrolase (AANH) superfamily ATPase
MHICCAPCSIFPINRLRSEAMEIRGFFYRHNIHPWKECERREEALRAYAETISLPVIYQKGYDMEVFLQNVAFRESDRCRYCYHDRLKTTALLAKRGRFDCFTSTLLYSKFQQHDVIRATGEAVAKSTGIPFLYRDFREGWKEGVDQSKAFNMYRQPYCGCIYSEKERYYKAR